MHRGFGCAAMLLVLFAAPQRSEAGRERMVEILRPWVEGFVVAQAPPASSVDACEQVQLKGLVRGRVYAAAWTLEAGPPVALEAGVHFGKATFRAPAVAEPTRMLLRFSATSLFGISVSATTEVLVQPAPVAAGLVPGAYLDCAPFEYGVASGDPLPGAVLLWTRVAPAAGESSATVSWEVARDPSFAIPVASGVATTDASRDFSVEVEASGLAPAATYYYRFQAADGRTSSLGRTRTAPAAAASHLRFAVISCSSLFSGYFNAYQRIAEHDLDLVIHLGDYLYDFVDRDERVRIPEAFPIEPATLAEWRGRHADYLADADLRRARASHPWAFMWDNHDVEWREAPDYRGSVQAFREWNPMRDPDPGRPDRAYRTLRYGDLVDVVLMDVLLFRQNDLLPGTDEPNILGNEQLAWLEATLRDSTAAWRIFGSQKPFATIRVDPALARFISGEAIPYFDLGTWDGFLASRTRLLNLLAQEGIDDNVVISGDAHVSLANDLVDYPTMPYDPATGVGSVGVEFMPPSIARGNFDEELTGIGFGEEALPAIIEYLRSDTAERNPHQRYSELTSHGYGILDVTPERVVAEYWYVPILEPTTEQENARTLLLPRGANHWNAD